MARWLIEQHMQEDGTIANEKAIKEVTADAFVGKTHIIRERTSRLSHLIASGDAVRLIFTYAFFINLPSCRKR